MEEMASFYLFDVGHGQCAAIKLPNNRWCIFDLGRTEPFSPVKWIVNHMVQTTKEQAYLFYFHFLKATISHLHGDHIADQENLFQYQPESLFTVQPDSAYLEDCYATCSDDSAKNLIDAFRLNSAGVPTTAPTMVYQGIRIREMALPVSRARQLGGNANSRVNNASVVTRIDIHGVSILLCGDIEKEGWSSILTEPSAYGIQWWNLLTDIDIMIAPHHGHQSGFSTELINFAKPSVVLVSVVTKDQFVDNRYSKMPVRGLILDSGVYRCITTRKHGHIRVDITPNPPDKGTTYWTFGPLALC